MPWYDDSSGGGYRPKSRWGQILMFGSFSILVIVLLVMNLT